MASSSSITLLVAGIEPMTSLPLLLMCIEIGLHHSPSKAVNDSQINSFVPPTLSISEHSYYRKGFLSIDVLTAEDKNNSSNKGSIRNFDPNKTS